MTSYQLHHGDCLEVMATMADNSVDAIVTDPPYGLSFMGKNWDHGVPGEAFWREALRVAKPGAHLLAFGGTRTFHRLAVVIEDAGWEIRDTVMWVYGSGFPKSHDVSKAVDKAMGAERKVISEKKTNSGGMAHISKTNAEHGYRPTAYNGHSLDDTAKNCIQVTAPATPEAQQWQGWGTALKPAWEPVIVARKPLESTVAANVLKYGTGAINVDRCRVNPIGYTAGGQNNTVAFRGGDGSKQERCDGSKGRWPANVIHDGSEEVVGLFPVTTSGSRQLVGYQKIQGVTSFGGADNRNYEGDSGSAARFFYCAKASKRDRDEGCEGMEAKSRGQAYGLNAGGNLPQQTPHKHEPQRNHHPTVKPTDLMRYLCRLVTPPGGIVLDPFMGSGSTGKAAILEGFQFIGIEREAEYLAIAEARIKAISPVTQLSLL